MVQKQPPQKETEYLHKKQETTKEISMKKIYKKIINNMKNIASDAISLIIFMFTLLECHLYANDVK